MLNIDGVVNGNYRCSLVGCDLNRRWKTPLKLVHPVIYSFKELIRSFTQTHHLDLIADFHGHSRKHNVFAYGCNLANTPHLTKLFPYTLSRLSPVFSFENSRFAV
jgi:hypothetical protein